jgi:PHP family Zn ribbon phosphoesterase
MIPPLIIETAQSRGINLIAISDHNAIANIEAVMQAAQGSSVTVLPAIELQTREEIHSLCLFDSLAQITDFFEQVLPSMPEIRNNVEFFGEQFVVDATGDFIRREDRLLISSCSLSLKEAWQLVAKHQGLMIPAHVNRSAFGLFPVLGFIPQDIDLEVLEISRHITPAQALSEYPQLANYRLIQSGDAHFLDDILGWNEFFIEKPTVNEIRKAIIGTDGRKYHNLSTNS